MSEDCEDFSEEEGDAVEGVVVQLNPHDLDDARETACHTLIAMMMHETDKDMRQNRREGMQEPDAFAAAMADNMKLIVEAAFMIGVGYQEMRQRHSYDHDRAG